MENPYAIARREAEEHADFIDLIDTNFHSCGFRHPGDTVRRATDLFVANADFRYLPDPAGDRALRAAIAAYYEETGARVDADSVVVTASASESYSHIFASRCRAGDRVLLPQPGYPMFEEIAARHGLIVDFYQQHRESGWRMDVDEIDAKIGTSTAALVLISPNNPTGSVVSVSTVRRLGESCLRHGLFLVVDEVFSGLVFGPTPLPRPAALIPDVLVFTINGVSKLFASPELKISWVVVTGPEHKGRSRISRGHALDDLTVQNDLFLSASSLSQAIAAEMFRDGMQFTQELRTEVDRRRQLMLNRIRHIDGLSAVDPMGGIHLPVTIDRGAVSEGVDDEDVAVALLEEHHLATHPGYLYGLDDSLTLVLSFLAPADRITDGLARLERYLRFARS